MGEKKAEKSDGGEKKGDGAAAKKGDGAVTVVLKLDMHCEGCAKKVRRSVKNFDGVESVKADCASNKLTVIGKVDPVKIKERVEEKTKKKVELVSPQPKKDKEGGGGGGDKKPDTKSEKKSDDNKKAEEKKPKEPSASTVVLKTRVHCEGCAQKMKKILGKCDGVQDVNVDLPKDQITVKGTMNMKELLPYLNTKLKRVVEIASAAKKDDAGAGDKKKEGGGGGGGEKKEGGGDKKGKEGGGGGDKKADGKPSTSGGGDGGKSKENPPKIEVNKMEYYGYPYSYNAYTYDPSQGFGNGQVVEYMHEPHYSHEPHYLHAPQMFSDENPNACSIM
ncbi:hypothetical protein Ancab_014561 [Ancistrocladus abbreviatus]